MGVDHPHNLVLLANFAGSGSARVLKDELLSSSSVRKITLLVLAIFTAGMRWDRHSVDDVAALSPRSPYRWR